MNLLLIVHDGEKLRAFHESAVTITDNERDILRGIAMDLVKRANALTNGHDSREHTLPVGVLSDGSSMWREPMMSSPLLTQGEMARNAGYTGEVCPSCHGLKMRRTGTCVTCQDCGHNAGCG